MITDFTEICTHLFNSNFCIYLQTKITYKKNKQKNPQHIYWDSAVSEVERAFESW